MWRQGSAAELAVSIRDPRNCRTASRNNAAPRSANRRGPPAASTNRTRRTAAWCRSSEADRRMSVIAADIAVPNHRARSTDTADQRWSTALCGASSGARLARWRYSRSRSSTRAPSPSIQSFTVRDTTRAAPAMLVTAAPSTSARPTASRITSTPVTFPGSASYGNTRSRCPHWRHCASATLSIKDSPRSSSRRSTRLPVSRRSLLPHAAHQHPTSNSSPDASTTAVYLLDSTSSTKTTCS